MGVINSNRYTRNRKYKKKQVRDKNKEVLSWWCHKGWD